MTVDAGRNEPWRRAAMKTMAAASLVALGAAGTYIYMRRSMSPPARSEATAAGQSDETMPPASGSASPRGTGVADREAGSASPRSDVRITLTPEAVHRSGIATAPVRRATQATSLRLPAVVEPNAYRQVSVRPLVAGRITSVAAALGDRVSRGQTLAQIYSPELPDAQTQYLTMTAELDAAHQRLRRTERLVEIGAASTQELETIRAEHTKHATAVEGARARLTLLGFGPERLAQLRTAADVTATVAVPAPLAGVVTERTANVGLNVDSTTALFKVVDLSTVWVVADLYERDFARVAIGSLVTVTSAAYPGLGLPGKVSYVDPQVNPDTRTAKVRIEVPNRGQRLRLGVYADVLVRGSASSAVLVVPRTAVQTVDDRQVVYLADRAAPGTFVERDVRLGNVVGEDIQVTSGVMPTDLVVAEGSFSLRAERDRLGLGAAGGGRSSAESRPAPSRSSSTEVQEVRVIVTDMAFEPPTLTLRAGIPARVTFVRTGAKACATEVAFPSLGVKKSLPLNEPVTIELTPQSAGEIAFACGMNMLKGRLVIEAR